MLLLVTGGANQHNIKGGRMALPIREEEDHREKKKKGGGTKRVLTGPEKNDTWEKK